MGEKFALLNEILILCFYHQEMGEKFALFSKILMERLEGVVRVVEAEACIQPQVTESKSDLILQI